MIDVGVIHEFDRNHAIRLKNLKIFTAELIFSTKNITNKEDTKSLCISAVNNRRFMLPVGASLSDFILQHSQHLKTCMYKVCANSQNNARHNYQGDRTQHVVQSLQAFLVYIGVHNILFMPNFTSDLVKGDVVPEDRTLVTGMFFAVDRLSPKKHK